MTARTPCSAALRILYAEGSPARADTGPNNLLADPLNDYGNALRLKRTCGSDLRYCHPMKKWLVWDGQRWVIDTTEQARRLATKAMLAFHEEATDARNEQAESFARRALDARRLAAALEMLQAELFVMPEQLDADPHVLNVRNGVIDLRTGELLPHSPERFCTKLVNVAYSPDATYPTFGRFLTRIMGGGLGCDNARAQRLIEYLQKAFGYSLTAVTNEKAVFICHGSGNNGKSTLLSTFLWMLGEYATLLQVDTLMVRQESNNSQADLADLRGARFIMTSETEEGQRLSEGKLKRITQGMGRIKTCRKYENPIDFEETHKLWMDANHKPVVRGLDNAIWNRLHLIPFDAVIPDEEIDRELPRKLQAEAEGILAWAVAGAVRWYAEGLGRPPEIDQAREAYRTEMNPLQTFFEEACLIDPDTTCNPAELFRSYRTWAEDAGERRPLSQREFVSRMEAAGFVQERDKHGRTWLGIRPMRMTGVA